MAGNGRIGLEVEGLVELRQAFAKADRKRLDAGLRGAHKEIAKTVESDSRSAAASGTAQQQKAIRVLLGRGTPTSALIAIRNTGAVPFGIGAFMGAVEYKQFPDWVGTAWDIEAGDGPYVVAETIARNLGDIVDTYAEAMADTLEAVGLPVT